jgi:hypothetical protein
LGAAGDGDPLVVVPVGVRCAAATSVATGVDRRAGGSIPAADHARPPGGSCQRVLVVPGARPVRSCGGQDTSLVGSRLGDGGTRVPTRNRGRGDSLACVGAGGCRGVPESPIPLLACPGWPPCASALAPARDAVGMRARPSPSAQMMTIAAIPIPTCRTSTRVAQFSRPCIGQDGFGCWHYTSHLKAEKCRGMGPPLNVGIRHPLRNSLIGRRPNAPPKTQNLCREKVAPRPD